MDQFPGGTKLASRVGVPAPPGQVPDQQWEGLSGSSTSQVLRGTSPAHEGEGVQHHHKVPGATARQPLKGRGQFECVKTWCHSVLTMLLLDGEHKLRILGK